MSSLTRWCGKGWKKFWRPSELQVVQDSLTIVKQIDREVQEQVERFDRVLVTSKELRETLVTLINGWLHQERTLLQQLGNLEDDREDDQAANAAMEIHEIAARVKDLRSQFREAERAHQKLAAAREAAIHSARDRIAELKSMVGGQSVASATAHANAA